MKIVVDMLNMIEKAGKRLLLILRGLSSIVFMKNIGQKGTRYIYLLNDYVGEMYLYIKVGQENLLEICCKR